MVDGEGEVMMKERVVMRLLGVLSSVLLSSLLIVILVGCERLGGGGAIVFESLRDAPSFPLDPNYEDFQRSYLKYLEIYSMNVGGGGVRRLTRDTYSQSQADVSPDGTKILCTIHYSPKGQLTGLEPGWEIAVMNVDGSDLKNLTNNDYMDTAAHWNHNGTKIVYASDTAQRREPDMQPGNDYVPIRLDIYTMNADGSGKRRLTSAKPGEAYSDPSFSFSEPSRILYNHDRDFRPPNQPDLYVMDADGGNKRLVLRYQDVHPRATTINDPMFSPDGNTIIFESLMGRDQWGHVIYNIFTVDVSGANVRRWTRDETVSEGMPQYSPDGTKLTFDRVTWSGQTLGTRHIWVANVDGTGERRLSSFRYDGSASWFPAGE